MVMFYALETWQAIIINDKWHSERKESIEEEAKRIVCAAAKIIRGKNLTIHSFIPPMKTLQMLRKVRSGYHTIYRFF